MCATPLAFFHTAIGISAYQGRCPFLLLSLIIFLICWNYSLSSSRDLRLLIWTRNYVPIGFRKGLSLSSKISVCTRISVHTRSRLLLRRNRWNIVVNFSLPIRFRLSNPSIHQVRFRRKHVRGSALLYVYVPISRVYSSYRLSSAAFKCNDWAP